MASRKAQRPPKTCLFCVSCVVLPLAILWGGTTLFTCLYRDNINGLTQEVLDSRNDLKVRKAHLTNENGVRSIVGEVSNASHKKTYVAIGITFHLYDKSGFELDQASAENEIALKPGSTWHFKAPIDEPTARTFKLNQIFGIGDLSADPNIPPALRAKFKEMMTAGKTAPGN